MKSIYYTFALWTAFATCRSLAQDVAAQERQPQQQQHYRPQQQQQQQEQEHSISRALQQQPRTCQKNQDCTRSQFCSDGVCREQGTCQTLVDCFNPANSYAAIECMGFLKCEKGTCERECSPSPCPDNLSQPRCAAEPCGDPSKACDEPYTVCIDDYCGGCNAIFLNASGTQVCTAKESSSSSSTSSKTCRNHTDCTVEEEYCAHGICRPHGYCSTVRDCQNPANQYTTILCMGYLTCEHHACGMECSENACANNVTEAKCSATPPCNTTKCNVPHDSCVNDKCGGCHAIFFNATGDTVCLPKKPDNSTTTNSTTTCNDSCQGQRGVAKVLVCLMNKMIGRNPTTCSDSV